MLKADSMENVLSNLKSEDVKVKLNSISNLATVAANIGHEKTRTDLIPYINECLEDENEVTLAYAEQISKFVPLVGGYDHAFVLLPTLEILSENDEVNVRNKAVDILCHMAEHMPIQHLNENFIPFIERLSSNDWFTLKSSACGLFASIYPRVEEEKKKYFKKSISQFM
jgi:serine/threonine-protein phosphatase 2A regulatory subunit A